MNNTIALDPIVAFYLDSRAIHGDIGFTFTDVFNFTDEELEECHSYIQWAFPLKEPSQFNPDAPLVTDATIMQMNDIPSAKVRILGMGQAMLRFYITENPVWITPKNHNFLRITRIIKSLRIFGYISEAAFFHKRILMLLQDNPQYVTIVGETTLQFWKEANES